jgi:hypothetical protein
MRIMQTPGYFWPEVGMKQIPIHTWKRDDIPIIFDSIRLTSYAIEPDWLVYTIRFHDPQTTRQFVSVWTVTPTLIGEIRVKSHGAPKRIADWIEECLIDALCSHTGSVQ